VDAPAKFHVETFAAGKGSVDVIVINPKGQREKVNSKKDHMIIFSRFVSLSLLFVTSLVIVIIDCIVELVRGGLSS
jgi:hypothetical protein